jgi:hypothetical protein
MKKCPYCAEEIQDAAIVCKHCGRDLLAPPGVQPANPSMPAWEQQARTLAANGDKIAAIKKVRENGGLGLAEAKTLVESWPGPPPGAVAASTKTGCSTWLIAIVLVLMFVGWCSSQFNPTPSTGRSSPASTGTPAQRPPRPAEPVLEILSKRGSASAGGGYMVVEGEVKNLTDTPLKSIQVVSSWYDEGGKFITSDSAMIEYDPLMPGQTSPFKTMTRGNPLMKRFSVEFKPIFGPVLRTKDSDP